MVYHAGPLVPPAPAAPAISRTGIPEPKEGTRRGEADRGSGGAW